MIVESGFKISSLIEQYESYSEILKGIADGNPSAFCAMTNVICGNISFPEKSMQGNMKDELIEDAQNNDNMYSMKTLAEIASSENDIDNYEYWLNRITVSSAAYQEVLHESRVGASYNTDLYNDALYLSEIFGWANYELACIHLSESTDESIKQAHEYIFKAQEAFYPCDELCRQIEGEYEGIVKKHYMNAEEHGPTNDSANKVRKTSQRHKQDKFRKCAEERPNRRQMSMSVVNTDALRTQEDDYLTAISEGLSELFGQSWEKFDPKSRVYITTAQFCFETLSKICIPDQKKVDFSAAVVPLMKALELELTGVFVQGYLRYLKKEVKSVEEFCTINDIDLNALRRNCDHPLIAIIYGKLQFRSTDSENSWMNVRFTLGNLNYLSGYSAEKDRVRFHKTLLNYCDNYVVRNRTFSSEQWLRHIVESVDLVRKPRNSAAHAGAVIVSSEAQSCFNRIMYIKQLLKDIVDVDIRAHHDGPYVFTKANHLVVRQDDSNDADLDW